MTAIDHGTYVGYRVQQCRCEECRAWKRDDNTKNVSKPRNYTHGTVSAYRYGCRCDGCKQAKRAENAISNPRRTDPHWNPEPPRKYRNFQDYNLTKTYGLSLDEWEAMADVQEGRCDICQLVPDRGLVVDHCHDTGRVRSLLCNHCNTALGFARENPDVLRRMADYVERHRLIN